MDDIELGLSSGTSFLRDEFYESFQAPKFYDFINPRESGNADQWFLDGFPRSSIKDLVHNTVQSILQTSSNNPSRKESLIKDKENPCPYQPRPSKYEHCSENKDPNQVKPVGTFPSKVSDETSRTELGKTVKKRQKSGETSPVPHMYRYLAGTSPATVPQKKKVLGTRRATPFSKAKALFAKLKDDATAARHETECSSSRASGSPNKETVLACTTPAEGGAARQDEGDAAAKYVVEQAIMLESAIKLLKLDEEKNVKVCTEVLGAVCADGKQEEVDNARAGSGAQAQQTKPAFSFKAVRKETMQQTGRRRRKSIEAAGKRKNMKKTIAPVVCPSTTLLPSAAKRPSVTCPQPFRLRTEERGALKEIEFNKRMEQYIALREGSSTSTKAIPLKRKLARPAPPAPPRTKDGRTPVEVSIEMITNDLAAKNKLSSESEESRKQRRQKRMPLFDRPFRPQRSTKKLTIPVEPKFHSINAPRTCSKHCHTNAQ